MLGYLAGAAVLLVILLPHMGTEIFPDAGRSHPAYPAAGSGRNARGGDRTAGAARARRRFDREIGPENIAITSDFVGVVPSSYPVNLIHLFTSGPHEAVIQIALKAGAPRGEPLREKLRARLRQEFPDLQVSFEAGDIVSQVMSFGSPTPIEVAVQGVSLQDDSAYAQKVYAEMAKLPFLRDLQYAQELNYPTLDITIDRERAGQFGLNMADVSRSIVPATSSSRFIQPNYWRDPVSGNAFQIQVQLPQNRMQGTEELGGLPVMRGRGRRNPVDRCVGDESRNHAGTDRTVQRAARGLAHRQHPRRDAGRSGAELNAALARVGTPPKGVSVKYRGQIPPLEQTISGLRVGLLLAVLVIFLLLAANFQSVRLAMAIVLTHAGGAVRRAADAADSRARR